ncbi:hypothetical protein Agub_g1463, partial [Astrephomene gubernaculifera]
IDCLLGGGLREGTVVEVVGETASGKTQLCLAAAATTAGRGEAVLFVDTTGSFTPERVLRLAEAEAAAMADGGGGGIGHPAGDPSLASRVLGCIAVVRPGSVFQLLGVLDRLEAELQQQGQGQGQNQQGQQLPGQGQEGQQPGGGQPGGAPEPPGMQSDAAGGRVGPRLLVVDSVSALLSTVLGSNQHTQGTALLTAVGRMLKQLAERYSIAVLVTNHVTSATHMARGGRG